MPDIKWIDTDCKVLNAADAVDQALRLHAISPNQFTFAENFVFSYNSRKHSFTARAWWVIEHLEPFGRLVVFRESLTATPSVVRYAVMTTDRYPAVIALYISYNRAADPDTIKAALWTELEGIDL